MKKCFYDTQNGRIVYWINEFQPDRKTLVFLPGLTADHRLFGKQVAHFKNNYNIFVWDAPGHAASRPFVLDFDLMDKARWLHEILEKEGVAVPILIGQSMGGYVSQAYLELYPDQVAGFVSIDSCPLQREYVTAIEIWLLKRMAPVYKLYPWKALLRDGSNGCATTAYGRRLMRAMMETYTGDKDCYCKLAGHGYRILAEAMEANLPYEITCPAVLICGEKDMAGSAKAYNKKWTKKTGLTMHWIGGAGHNSNTDKPEEINLIIEEFAATLATVSE